MLCVNPVSTLRTITCDCGRTALFESTTFPPKLAVVYCAYTGETHRTKTPATIENAVGDGIVTLLCELFGFRPHAARTGRASARGRDVHRGDLSALVTASRRSVSLTVPVIDACAKASAGTKTNHESTVVNFTNPRIAHLRSGRLTDLGLNYGCGAETVKVLSGDFALLDQRLTFASLPKIQGF